MKIILSIFLFVFLLLLTLYEKESFMSKKNEINKYYPVSLNLFDNDRRKLNVKTKVEKASGHYDYTTFVYNIFLDYNNKNLVLNGPPLLNNRPKYMNLDVFFNGKKMSLTSKKYANHFYILKYKVNEVKQLNEVKIKVGNTIKTVKIYKNDYKCGDRILITKQKNNRIRWIKDWIEYYTNRYNISNIVIFDNNSDNFNELKNSLMVYDNVTLIPYNYPFGIPKVFNTNFLQYALLNIALDQFCSENTYIFNFDIDEMLMVDPKHLNNILSSKDVYYKVRTWWVPMTLDKNNEYSFKDFKYKDSSSINKGEKYIVNKQSTTELSVHFPKTRCKLKNDGGYFLHFRGISTNWKYNRLEKQSLDGLIKIDKF